MSSKVAAKAAKAARREQLARDRKYVLEILFVALLSLVILAAFFEAMTYDIVSSRTPFVIMAPLIILLGLHINKLRKKPRPNGIKHMFSGVFTDMPTEVRFTINMFGWLMLMCIVIIIAGHYAGIALFMFITIHFVAKEPFKIALLVTLATTLIIYVLFEYGFNIELYRGMIYRYAMGYRIF